MRHALLDHPRPGTGRRRILNTDGSGPDVRQAGELRSARVESLRAVAALAVLEGHIYGTSVGFGPTAYRSWFHRALLGGGFGVYLFFTLSGYLLFLPFARQHFGSGRPVDLARYARNRALRILPLYYAVAIVYLLVLRAPGVDWAAYLLFGETFSSHTVAQVDGPMWSLVVEVMFYVLLPFLAFALAGLSRRSLPMAAAGLVALAAAAGGYRWVAYLHASHPGPLVQYNLPANFFFFLPGMLLALTKVASEGRRPGQRVLSPVLADSRLWVAASAALWAVVFYRYQWDLLAGVASFLLLGACVLPLRPSAPVRILGWRPLALLGTASYSLYLWHLPIVVHLGPEHLGGYVGHLVIDAAVCIAVSLASYRLIEAPFLRWRERWGDTASGSTPAPAR
ncbi:MAG TPA: acyltransferase [Acidimicrobiales bacterium]|nr:acyltransferase [Acidimicrobiales bacterium]